MNLRTLLLFTLALIFMLITSDTTLACDCITAPPSESFKRADLVFKGEVVRKTEIPIRGAFIFRVGKVLKGSPVSEITIAGTGYNCDAWFTTDVVYRVYAHHFQGKLISNQCSGNKILKGKESDPNNWPSLSYLRNDYKAVSEVVHIRIQQAEITSRVGGYENWKVVAVVLESLKGVFKKGEVIEYLHRTEAGFKREYFTRELIVFLLAESEDGKPRYSVLENSTLFHVKDRVRKLRLIRAMAWRSPELLGLSGRSCRTEYASRPVLSPCLRVPTGTIVRTSDPTP